MRFIYPIAVRCNGREYADHKGIDSCSDFIGEDSLLAALKEALPADATEDNVTFEGDSKWTMDHKDIFKAQVAS